jgi:hypothetical protein
VKDGAGLLRVNQEKVERTVENHMVLNALSFEETSSQLRSAIDPTGNDVDLWIESVWDSYVIFQRGGKYWKQDYAVISNKVSLKGVPLEVIKRTVYEDTTGVAINVKGERNMEKEAMVAAIVNGGRWKDEDKTFLMTLNEDQLAKMVPEEPKANEDPTPPAGEEPPAPVVEKAEPTVNEYVASAPKEIQEVLTEALHNAAQRRADLVKEITSNKANTFTKEALTGMTINQLVGIAAIARAAVPTKPSPSYVGQAPVANVSDTKEEPLAPPTMNFAKQDA